MMSFVDRHRSEASTWLLRWGESCRHWSGSWGLHRRSAPYERAAIKEGREVGLLDRALERARLGTRHVPTASSLFVTAAEVAPDVIRFAAIPLIAGTLRLELAA